MIYTVGAKNATDALIKEGYARRLGRQGQYQGSAVWPSIAAAKQFLTDNQLAGWDVYEIEADWDDDTAPSLTFGAGYHELLKDARIRRLVCLHV